MKETGALIETARGSIVNKLKALAQSAGTMTRLVRLLSMLTRMSSCWKTSLGLLGREWIIWTPHAELDVEGSLLQDLDENRRKRGACS